MLHRMRCPGSAWASSERLNTSKICTWVTCWSCRTFNWISWKYHSWVIIKGKFRTKKEEMQKGRKSSESKERKGLGWLCGGGLRSNAEAKLRDNHKKLLFRKGGFPGRWACGSSACTRVAMEICGYLCMCSSLQVWECVNRLSLEGRIMMSWVPAALGEDTGTCKCWTGDLAHGNSPVSQRCLSASRCILWNSWKHWVGKGRKMENKIKRRIIGVWRHRLFKKLCS